MARIKRMAKRLNQLRSSTGWTQQERANRAGVSRVHVARPETAKIETTLGVLKSSLRR